MDDDEYHLRKEDRRGSGRKGVQTSKSRQKRNCSKYNHGCHGYVWEPSLGKVKGRHQERHRYLLDSSNGRCVELLLEGRGRVYERRITDSKTVYG